MEEDTRECVLDVGAFLCPSRVEAAPGRPRHLEKTEKEALWVETHESVR